MKNKRPSAGLIVLITILLGMMVTGTVILLHSRSSRLREWLKINEIFQIQNRGAENIENTKKQRAAFFTKHLLLDYPPKLSFATADFLRYLSEISPDWIRLQTLKINAGVGSFSFRLSGMILSASREEAQKSFLEIEKKLRELENLIDTSSEGIRPGVSQEQRTFFAFAIAGEVGLE